MGPVKKMELKEAIKISKLFFKIRAAFQEGQKFTKGRKKFNKETQQALQILIDHAQLRPKIDKEELLEIIVDELVSYGTDKRFKFNAKMSGKNWTRANWLVKAITKKAKRWLK